MIDIVKARELCEKATKGPWELVPTTYYSGPIDVLEVSSDASENWIALVQANDNAQFISVAREALPHFINRCLELEAENDGLKESAARDFEAACAHCDRADTAEVENRKMRAAIDKAIRELHSIPDAFPAMRHLERAYVEAPDPCMSCSTQSIICDLGMSLADTLISLAKATTFIPGCPPADSERVKACKEKPEGARNCPECWEGHLLDQARARREAAL